jgi:extracellular elastinolytic metalloproteinase
MAIASRFLVLAFCLATAAFGPALAVQFPESGPKADLDVRFEAGGGLLKAPTAAQLGAAEALRSELPGLTMRWDGVSGSPRWLAAPAGRALSAPSRLDPESAARVFFEARAVLFGMTRAEMTQLEFTSSVPAPEGGTHLYFTQRIDGLEVYGGRLNVTLRADGAVIHLGSRLHSGIDSPPGPLVTAVDAVGIAALDVYSDRKFGGTALEAAASDDAESKTLFDEPEFGRPPRARLVLFPDRDGARLAWEVRIAEPGIHTDYRILVDARDGRILTRHNMVFHASARVLLAGSPDPETEEWAPTQHQLVEIPASTPESPQGWFGGDDTTMQGNNASAQLFNRYHPGLSEPDGVYDYRFNTNESALVNAWYWVNDAHDRFYALGFDEVAGNFQEDNFGLGGVDGDAVTVRGLAGTVPGCAACAASITSTVDGESALMYFAWRNDCRFCSDHDGYPDNGGDRSGGFMRDVLYHEYSHAVTTRRVGGPADNTCMLGIQSGAMAEGWSDLLAASFFDEPAYSRYETEGLGWQRHAVNDLSYGDLCLIRQHIDWFACNRGYDGMIWSGTLWDLRQSMIALDPAGGLDDFHLLMVEALASTPCNPTMLDGRDAILVADNLLNGSANHQVIWNVFASRGFGVGALTTGEDDSNPYADTNVPAIHECTPPAAPSGLTATVDGANSVRLDYDATGAASVEIWREDVDNPADAPELIAFTTDNAGYTDAAVQGGKSYRYHVVALGGGGTVCRGNASGTAAATASGGCDEEFPLFIPDLTITDGDPSCAVTLSWTPATEACPGSGEPIVYNVYRYGTPGFPPGDQTLIGRTTATTFVATAPVKTNESWWWFDINTYYLVLAQHGTLEDPPDHRDRGSSQVLDWEPGLPTLGRTTVHFWDYETGDQGWTSADWGGPPENDWVLADPTPTWFGGVLLSPDEAPDGSGVAWVTGDPGGGPVSSISHDAQEAKTLESPSWDSTGGATILSFDYWARPSSLSPRLEAFWISISGGDDHSLREFGLPTTQRFNGPGRYGWQRAELDISKFVTPDASTYVYMAGADTSGLMEFGIDNVRVEQATVCATSDLRLNGVTVDDSPTGWGNGNGFLEPGEIARLSVELLNNGTTTASTPTGVVRSRAPGAAVLDADASWPDIPPAGTSSTLGDGFTVAAPADGACIESVVFEFELIDASGERTTAVWSPEYGEVLTESIFEDDFETDKGWAVSGAGMLQGMWVRADPNGTMDGPNQANPEDCAEGAGTKCYVTGTRAGPVDYDDVDPAADAILRSPSFGVDGYKRVTFNYATWFYNSTSPSEDNALEYAFLLDDDSQLLDGRLTYWLEEGWCLQGCGGAGYTLYLDPREPLGSDLRMSFVVTDGESDDIVEAGIDSVSIEGVRQVCDPVAINPPNEVGATLYLSKAGSDASLVWSEPSVDGTHDATIYYAVYASSSPQQGFRMAEAPMSAGCTRPLSGGDRYYVVSAANGGGTSGEEPPP